MINYYQLYPILTGGSTQEAEALRAARNRMILAMLNHERLGSQSVAIASRDRGLYPLSENITNQIPNAQLRADLQKWIDSPIQFNNEDGSEIEYSDINAHLEREYPILTQLANQGITNLNQLLGHFILNEYNVTKLVTHLNNNIALSLNYVYTRRDFPDSLLRLLYTKATNPLSSNGLELTPEMIIHGRVPDTSIWKRFVQNLDEEPKNYQRIEKGGFKVIAQLFIMNGEIDEFNEFLTEHFNTDETDTLGVVEAFNNFISNRPRKIYWFNKIFNQLYEQRVFKELIRIL